MLIHQSIFLCFFRFVFDFLLFSESATVTTSTTKQDPATTTPSSLLTLSGSGSEEDGPKIQLAVGDENVYNMGVNADGKWYVQYGKKVRKSKARRMIHPTEDQTTDLESHMNDFCE